MKSNYSQGEKWTFGPTSSSIYLHKNAPSESSLISWLDQRLWVGYRVVTSRVWGVKSPFRGEKVMKQSPFGCWDDGTKGRSPLWWSQMRTQILSHRIHGILVYLPTFGCFFVVNVGKKIQESHGSIWVSRNLHILYNWFGWIFESSNSISMGNPSN